MVRGEKDPAPDVIDVEHERYPDVQFEVDSLHLFQRKGEIFEISDEIRLARALNLLGQNFPQFNITPDERKKRLDVRKNYLRSKVAVDDKRVRRNVLDTDSAYSEVTRLLKAYNHPAIQLAEQIDSVHNSEHEHDFEMRKLGEDIVTMIAWDELKHILELQAKGERFQSTQVAVGETALTGIDTLAPPTPAA